MPASLQTSSNKTSAKHKAGTTPAGTLLAMLRQVPSPPQPLRHQDLEGVDMTPLSPCEPKSLFLFL